MSRVGFLHGLHWAKDWLGVSQTKNSGRLVAQGLMALGYFWADFKAYKYDKERSCDNGRSR